MKRRRSPARTRRASGLTLIELLVAMVIGLVIVLAAVASLTVARTGFTAVDAASQLRDSGRFASDLLQRIGTQAGYRDVFIAAGVAPTDPARTPSLGGFDNRLVNPTDPTTAGNARSASDVGFGSDVLILRYQAAQLYSGAADPVKAKIADQSMIDCAGNTLAAVANPADTDPTKVTDAYNSRVVSIFHVAINQGEPALMCTYSSTGTAPWTTVPLIQGVENFQVLYGTDGVSAGVATTATSVPDVPDRYLRANQINMASDVGTKANWRRVRSLRIGMVLRAAQGSAQGSTTQVFHPFGEASGGAALASLDDAGTNFTPTADTRLRQVVTFTVHLRNDQTF
ncbi:MAG: PilW family protein [Janthinobacterium lividum]